MMPSTAKVTVGELLASSKFVHTLERCKADATLLGNPTFQGVVYPDIPPISNPVKLIKNAGKTKKDFQEHDFLLMGRPIRTIAAQVRSRKKVAQIICDAASPTDKHTSAQALLLVSGGHKMRDVARPLMGSNLLDSFEMISTATNLRHNGYIDRSTAIWGVENPLVDGPERLERKIQAGAEAIVTQPPILWGKFEQWWYSSLHRGLIGTDSGIKIIVGLPIVGSVETLDFWTKLTQIHHLSESKDLVLKFGIEVETKGKDAIFQWNKRLLMQARDLPHVAGFHVMPINKGGVVQTKRLIEEGLL